MVDPTFAPSGSASGPMACAQPSHPYSRTGASARARPRRPARSVALIETSATSGRPRRETDSGSPTNRAVGPLQIVAASTADSSDARGAPAVVPTCPRSTSNRSRRPDPAGCCASTPAALPRASLPPHSPGLWQSTPGHLPERVRRCAWASRLGSSRRPVASTRRTGPSGCSPTWPRGAGGIGVGIYPTTRPLRSPTAARSGARCWWPKTSSRQGLAVSTLPLPEPRVGGRPK